MTSLAIQVESVILSLLIDAKEGRDMATYDVLGTYLLADMWEHVSVKFSDKTVKVMFKVNSKYKNA